MLIFSGVAEVVELGTKVASSNNPMDSALLMVPLVQVASMMDHQAEDTVLQVGTVVAAAASEAILSAAETVPVDMMTATLSDHAIDCGATFFFLHMLVGMPQVIVLRFPAVDSFFIAVFVSIALVISQRQVCCTACSKVAIPFLLTTGIASEGS